MQPQEIVVFDTPHPCSYLPGRTARLPYRHPVEKLTPDQFDERLAEGDRRRGVFLYRTQCPQCHACQPIRLDVESFRPDATQRRMQRRGDALLTVCDDERLTYAEADVRSRRIAKGLIAAGVGKGSHVALLFPNSPEFIVCLLAAARIGADVQRRRGRRIGTGCVPVRWRRGLEPVARPWIDRALEGQRDQQPSHGQARAQESVPSL